MSRIPPASSENMTQAEIAVAAADMADVLRREPQLGDLAAQSDFQRWTTKAVKERRAAARLLSLLPTQADRS